MDICRFCLLFEEGDEDVSVYLDCFQPSTIIFWEISDANLYEAVERISEYFIRGVERESPLQRHVHEEN